ncbi:MAG: GntR family transcriptional regulator [Azospirillaceae bacterium]
MKAAAPAGGAPLESQADEAYRLIEERIVTLDLPPGSVVTETRLTEMTGLGRTPVREALVRLKQDHLITVLPRQGILIRPIEAEYAIMALELRHLVERLIVERASALATPAERARLRAMADRMEAAADSRDAVGFIKLDHAFNTFLAAVARNPLAERTIAPLHAVSRRLGYYFARGAGRGLDVTGPAHVRLIRAIAAGHTAEAVEALDHLLDLTRRIAEAVGEETGDIGEAER